MHLPHCPALSGRATTWRESRAIGFQQSGTQPCSIWLAAHACLNWPPLLISAFCLFLNRLQYLSYYAVSHFKLSSSNPQPITFAKYIMNFAFFLIDRTITYRDIFQISPNHLPLTDFSSSFEVLQNLSISNCMWGFEWREAVVFKHILIFSLAFLSDTVTQGLLSFCSEDPFLSSLRGWSECSANPLK